MSTSEMDGVGSFATSASVVEDLPQPVEGNMQDTLESVLRNLVIEPTVGMEFGSLLENLAGLEAYHNIKYYLLKAVHHSMTVEEFEESWNHTITSHHLQENECSTTLKVFVEQFKNALRNKVEKEIKSDFDCFKGKLECSSSSPMEKQFQEAYTHEVFKWVRIEFSRRQDCIVKKIVRGGEEVKYKIQDEAAIMRVFEVRFSSSECLVGCRKNSVEASVDVPRNKVVRSSKVVNCKGRPRTKRLKSSMEEVISKPKKKRNIAAARNVAQSTSTTEVEGSGFGDDSTSNMQYPMYMSHSNDGVIDLTNPMLSHSFVLQSMSGSQAHGYKGETSNLI
uniref:Protein FAR1-RELATED SEQUENCE n=1 Tax=Fagus sylvatica TaxID=28930 RepID=A0A2N9FIK8_FAGSY